MDSTRLPGKVMMKLNGITSLQCLINQLEYSESINRKIVATTTNKEDDIIFEFAESKEIDVFRGKSLDVLDRYYQCAKKYSSDHIVRITADDPLIDPQIVDRLVRFYIKEDFDYVSNCEKQTFPYGTEVEVFSFISLSNAWRKAKRAVEREHVTPYIINNPNEFSTTCIASPTDLSHLRWTVDRKEDLQFVREIYKRISKRPILIEDILKVIEENPSLIEINKISGI